MKKKLQSKLWIHLSIIILLIMLITTILIAMGIMFLVTKDFIVLPNSPQARPAIFLLCFSIIIGTCVSLIFGKRVLKPVSKLRDAMREVAKGDLTVQMTHENKHQVEEIDDLITDFNLMVRELGRNETLRNGFIVDVSHEFKTPIASIKGYTQLLKRHDLTEAERIDYLNRVSDGAEQLSKLSGNILKLSKLEQQEIVINPENFALDEQLREVILFLQPTWEKNEICWDLRLPDVPFFGSRELLYQVWLNILDNAIKYSPVGGTITVSLIEGLEEVNLRVTDHGIGMDETTQKRVFDKFFQADTSRKGYGNGLGMALVKRIVELFHGTIKLDSKVGVGTTVDVILPKVSEPPVKSAPVPKVIA